MAEYRTARMRLERAVAHGESLAEMWNELPNDFLCRPRARLDLSGDNGQLVATEVGAVPDEFSLLLGEHLYQLRACLDSLIYQATVYATGQNPPPNENQLEFPMVSDHKEWPKVAKRRLSALSLGTQKGLELIQPFQAVNFQGESLVRSIPRSLGLLNDLARKDRHRQLHIVGSWPLEIFPQFTLPPGVTVAEFQTMAPAVLKEGSILATFRLEGFRPGMLMSVRPNLVTNIGCDDGPPACHLSDTFDVRLTEIGNAVNSVLAAFENNVLG